MPEMDVGMAESNVKAGSLYKSIFELSQDSIVTVDTKGFITSINPAGAKMLGYSVDELTGKHFAKIGYMNIRDIPKYVEIFTAAISGKDLKLLEINLTRKDGTPIVVEVRVGLLRENGKITGIQAITRDITERKKAEEALRAAETRIRGLMNAVPVGISLSTPDGHLVEANDELWKMFGYGSREEYLKVPAIEHYFDPKDREILGVLRKKGPVFHHEIRFKRKDGAVIWGSVNSIEEKSSDGKIYFVSSMLDVTERKKAEDKLRETNEYLDSLFNYANAPIIAWDTQYKITRFNHAFESLTGRAAKDVIGNSLEILFPPKEISASMELIRRTTTGERWDVVEIPILNVNGSIRTVLWNSAVIYSPDGETPVAAIAQGQDITERKEAEAKLKDSEERLKIIFESAPDAYYLNDLKGTFLDGNKAAEKVTGYKRDELIGKSFLTLKLLSPAQIPKAAAALARNLIGLPTGPDEFNLNKKDGTQVAIEISTHPVKIKGQTMVLGIARDLSERKKAEILLRESEEKFKAFFDKANDGFILATVKDKNFILGNNAICEMLGYTQEEIQTLGVMDIHPEKDLPYVIDQFERQARNEIITAENIPVKRKDGSVFYAEISSSPVILHGDPYLMGVFRNVTERKMAEEKIKESEARYRLIFNSSTDLLAHMDRTGTILDVNKQVLEIGGYEKDEITGKKISALTEIFPPQSIEVMLDNFTRDMLGEYHNPYEIEAKNKAGTRLFFEVGAVPLRSSTGEIVSMLAIMHDITERKAAEAVREELLHKVEEANRKKTEYVSDVSHELRTPLASIKGFVSTIRSDPAMNEPTRQDFLRITEEETDRLTRIIEDLLDISRIESGRLKLSMRSFNIMDLIMKNIENLKPQAESKGIVIQSQLAPAPFIVYADQDKTSQIMINLLGNAIKYNKENGKVTVSALQEDGKIRVDIEDTGIGISEKDLPHMFEKFFRAEGSSRETPGTGLGLAVTKSLVQVMGGMIEMQSKLGEGSKFSFSLPKYAGDKKEKVNEFS